MKTILTLLALLISGTVLAGEPVLPDGHYTLQMPWVDYESGHSHTGRIQKYEVSVTNTEFGIMLRCDEPGANSEWSTLYDHKNRKRSVNVVGMTDIPEPWHKVKFWFAEVERNRLEIDGLWGLCEAVILVQLSATKQPEGSWSGTSINSFDARAPVSARMKYSVAWSLTPNGVEPKAISGDIRYEGPELKRKPVSVQSMTSEKGTERPTKPSTATE